MLGLRLRVRGTKNIEFNETSFLAGSFTHKEKIYCKIFLLDETSFLVGSFTHKEKIYCKIFLFDEVSANYWMPLYKKDISIIFSIKRKC